jgi:hypothetical protein
MLDQEQTFVLSFAIRFVSNYSKNKLGCVCFIMFHLFLSENPFTKWFKKSKKSASISSSEDETALSISASSPAIPAPPTSH